MGRRGPPPQGSPEARLPPIGRTEDSIRRFSAAVVEGHLGGRISHHNAEIALAGANLALRAIKQKGDRNDIAELRELVKRAEDSVKAGVGREVADRQHRKVSAEK